ncbi:MAG: gluconate 2-dehydrogenase subunit 3 family protein [Bryobacterales bacterium]|nr:gluconate 2-dehydrogenase subunit 3 family protein [Bryobacterales bacterium]
MSNLVNIENVSRRGALKRIAGAFVAAGLAGEVNVADAQHVHAAAASLKGALGEYKRQFLTEHEWKTVSRLAEVIVPADEGGGSAVDAGAAEFIDLLCSQSEVLGDIYTGGVSSLDAAMRKNFGKEFLEADEKDQTRMLDMLVAEERTIGSRNMGGTGGQYAHFRDYQAWERPTLGAEAIFFDWVRKMAVDAYYTSPIGVKDLGYVGNGAFSTYEVPQAAIDYAMKRSPFA